MFPPIKTFDAFFRVLEQIRFFCHIGSDQDAKYRQTNLERSYFNFYTLCITLHNTLSLTFVPWLIIFYPWKV